MDDNVIPIRREQEWLPSNELLMMLEIIETDLKQYTVDGVPAEDIAFIHDYLMLVLSGVKQTN